MSNSIAADFIKPVWPAPENVHAISTTRSGGVSTAGYASLNLGDHVHDEPAAVASNRQQLVSLLQLPEEPRWLAQVHSPVVVSADSVQGRVEADASWTGSPDVVCTVLTADCLPVLMCDMQGRQVAAAHAGWRGLCAGVLEQTLAEFLVAGIPASELLVWLGPAIGPAAYEVDATVRDAFLARSPDCQAGFHNSFLATSPSPSHWQFDLYAAAREILQSIGISKVFGGDYCTYSDERFYSYRRQPDCGRQASLIWLTE
jgi:YfiH family protein